MGSSHNILLDLFTNLMDIDFSSPLIESSEEATAVGIYSSLQTIFGVNSYIVDPNLSLTNPYDTITSYAKVIQSFFKADSSNLKKPIIAIWNSENYYRSQENLNLLASDIFSWAILVILPKICKISAVAQEFESLLFIDSFNQPPQFPHDLLTYLNEDCQLLDPTDASRSISYLKVIENGSNPQRYNRYDSGWWAISNALMLIMYGNYEFLANFTDTPDRRLGYQLRQVYQKLELNLCSSLPEVPQLLSMEGHMDSQYIIQSQVLTKKRKFNFKYNSFRDVVQYSDGYVDKSLFIKEIIEDDECPIIISRPRKWGKTLNMEMIETFFQPEINKDGAFDFSQHNSNWKLFAGSPSSSDPGKKLRKLEISKDLLLMEKHQGKTPVIFLTLQCSGDQSKKNIKKDFRLCISRAYRSHDYIYKNQLIEAIGHYNEFAGNPSKLVNIKDKSIKALERVVGNNNILISSETQEFADFRNNNPSAHLRSSIYLLSKALNEFYGKPCYVIIDEYDASISSSLGSPNSNIITKILNKVFTTGLKGNNYVQKAIITGVLDLGESSIFSDMSHFSKDTVRDSNKYGIYFGLTEVEVENLLTDNVESYDRKLKKNIKSWYNGYEIGGNVIYNPLSILSCIQSYCLLSENPIKSYWIETESFELIKEMFRNLQDKNEIRDVFLNCECIECGLPVGMNYDVSPDNISSFYYLLYQSGYLTRNNNYYRIPNKEVKQYFFEEMLKIWIKESFSDRINVNKLLNELVENIEEIHLYKEIIQYEFLNFMDSSDKTVADFQALIAGISQLAYLNKISYVKHSVFCESRINNRNRIYTLFLPLKGKSDVAIIHEYKLSHRDKTAITFEDSFWQIYMNNHLSKVLGLCKEPHYAHLKYILVRVVIFFKDSLGIWSLEVKEFKHTVEAVESISNIFSPNGRLIHNHQLFYSSKSLKIEIRNEFLLHNSYSSLYELLDFYSENHNKNQKRSRDVSSNSIQDPQKLSSE